MEFRILFYFTVKAIDILLNSKESLSTHNPNCNKTILFLTLGKGKAADSCIIPKIIIKIMHNISVPYRLSEDIEYMIA